MGGNPDAFWESDGASLALTFSRLRACMMRAGVLRLHLHWKFIISPAPTSQDDTVPSGALGRKRKES